MRQFDGGSITVLSMDATGGTIQSLHALKWSLQVRGGATRPLK